MTSSLFTKKKKAAELRRSNQEESGHNRPPQAPGAGGFSLQRRVQKVSGRGGEAHRRSQGRRDGQDEQGQEDHRSGEVRISDVHFHPHLGVLR